MKPIAVLYATREGHTQQVAEHVAETLRRLGFVDETRNLRLQAGSIVLDDYSGVVLAASVHFGKHEREAVKFAQQHRAELEAMPAAFLSVTLSEASVERNDATLPEIAQNGARRDQILAPSGGARRSRCAPRQHAQAEADVERMTSVFFAETGWHPKFVKPIAGALLYSRYNPLLRFVMKGIAKAGGGDTDTSRDYDYTDWAALDRFVEEFATEIPAAALQ